LSWYRGCRPQLVSLEGRDLPSVDVLGGFPGLGLADTGGLPPNAAVAVGPEYVVEAVHDQLAFYDPAGKLVQRQSLDDFFRAVGMGYLPPTAEPVVAYDDLADRFVIGVADELALEFAVSNNADPQQGFAAMYKIDLSSASQNLSMYVTGRKPSDPL